MVKVGTDIVRVERVSRAAKNPQFLTRMFTPYEREYYRQKGNSPETLAGLYCAKEAAAKAMGCGIMAFNPHDAEVRHDEGGAPYLLFYDRAAQMAGCERASLSVSHDGEYAIAVCAIEV